MLLERTYVPKSLKQINIKGKQGIVSLHWPTLTPLQGSPCQVSAFMKVSTSSPSAFTSSVVSESSLG